MSKVQAFIKKHNIPRLGFGCMRLPTLGSDDKIDIEEFKKLVDTYIEAGFNYFDTAYMYHGGMSELAVKEAVVKRYPRESFILVDKLPIWSIEKKEDVEKIFNEQLEKCGTEYFDIYLLHALNDANNAKHEEMGSYEFCQKMKEQGKIKSFGFSFHGTTDDMQHIMQKHHEKFDIVQLQVNYFDWLGFYREQYEIVTSYGKPVVCMEPVRGGILARMPKHIESILKDANPDVSTASWAIRWVGCLPEVVTVLSGMSNMEQLKDNITQMSNFKPLTEDEYVTIGKAAQALKDIPTVPCTGCNYCFKCPKNIPIAKIFDLYNAFLGNRSMFQFKTAYKEIEQKNNASACISCGVCEAACPQRIQIPNRLAEISILMDV